MWSDASSPTPGAGFSLSLERGLTGATGFLKLMSFLRRNIAIRNRTKHVKVLSLSAMPRQVTRK